MALHDLDATPLMDEYRTLVLESLGSKGGKVDWHKLGRELVHTAEWTDEAAAHLLNLARNYGAFMLRNALALAVAAEIDDGELGF